MRRKYGKYEKQPVEAAKKPVKEKNILLHTYFTSLLSLVLCTAMFLGTSYAWFTSEVSNTGNEIYIGTLDVGFFLETDDTEEPWADLSDSEDVKFFDDSVCWEPGYTMLETVKIINEGDLAFNYVLNFTDGTVQKGVSSESETETTAESEEDSETETTVMGLAEIAKYFDVWVYDHQANENPPDPKKYADINTAHGWTQPWVQTEEKGTLDELLAGDFVLSGMISDVRDSTQAASDVNENTKDGKATEHTYTIALHMKEEATSEVMGHRIGLNVKLVAYQMVNEPDAMGDKTYDTVQVVSNLASLKEALAAAESQNILMVLDVEIDDQADVLTMTGGRLDGDSRRITYTGTTDDNVNVLTTSGGVIANLNVIAGENNCALYIAELESDLYVTNCVLSGAKAFDLDSEITDGTYIIDFADSTFNGTVTYTNVISGANFTNCTFTAALKPCDDTTLKNCTISGNQLDVSDLKAEATVTLENCTYNGTLIEKAVITNSGNSLQVDNTLLELDGDVVVLSSNS